MTTLVGARFLVRGKVQGVFFRASTAQEATRLNLTGHAVNLPDGRVEVLAMGAAAAVDELELFLGAGPPAARVDQVDRETVKVSAGELPQGFRTG